MSQQSTAPQVPAPPIARTQAELYALHLIQYGSQLLPMTKRAMANYFSCSESMATRVQRAVADMLAVNAEGTMTTATGRSGWTTEITDTKETAAISMIGRVTSMNSELTRLARNVAACPNGDPALDRVFADLEVAVSTAATVLATL